VKTWHIPHFKKIELIPEITIATFYIPCYRANFKAISCPVAEMQLETHATYTFSCKCNFWRCHVHPSGSKCRIVC